MHYISLAKYKGNEITFSTLKRSSSITRLLLMYIGMYVRMYVHIDVQLKLFRETTAASENEFSCSNDAGADVTGEMLPTFCYL